MTAAFKEPVLLLEGEGLSQRFRVMVLNAPHMNEILEREHLDGKPTGTTRTWVNQGERYLPTRTQLGLRIFRETITSQLDGIEYQLNAGES